MPGGFNSNLTPGLKPQAGGIKIVTVYNRSIFQVEWLITTLVFLLVFEGNTCAELTCSIISMIALYALPLPQSGGF